MKIVQPKPAKRSRWLPWMLLLLGVVVLGLFAMRQAGAATLDDFRRLVASRVSLGPAAMVPALRVDMEFVAYDTLLSQRNEALETGIFIGDDSDFVPATMTAGEAAVPVLIRLRQGPATHLADGDRWNLEVRTEDGARLLDMERFYLLDPADNHGANEWAYQRALAAEGIIPTRYQFARLSLNGQDRGVYALQEAPGLSQIEAQGLPPGVTVEFDPSPLWANVAHFGGDAAAAAADPVTNLGEHGWQFLEVDTHQDAAVARDETLSAQKVQAVNLLRGFQQGVLPASAVFDTDKVGMFLALSDLWGASDGTTLQNLRYFYNPSTERLEPVGFNGNPVLDGERIDLDAAAFDDATLQQAYVRAARQVADPVYLEGLREALGTDWEDQALMLGDDFSIEEVWSGLARRQEALRRSLQPIQPVYATYPPRGPVDIPAFPIDITNVVNLPIELVEIRIGDTGILPIRREWVSAQSLSGLISTANGIVLPAVRGGDRGNPAVVRLEIPLTEVYSGETQVELGALADISMGVRLWGTDVVTYIPVRPSGVQSNPITE